MRSALGVMVGECCFVGLRSVFVNLLPYGFWTYFPRAPPFWRRPKKIPSRPRLAERLPAPSEEGAPINPSAGGLIECHRGTIASPDLSTVAPSI